MAAPAATAAVNCVNSFFTAFDSSTLWKQRKGRGFRLLVEPKSHGRIRSAIVYNEYTKMQTEKIGIREFRENLAGYLEAGRPLAITRHGETLGFFIPARKRSRKAEVEAMRAAAKELDAMIAKWGASEDELMQEYKQLRQTTREKKRKP